MIPGVRLAHKRGQPVGYISNMREDVHLKMTSSLQCLPIQQRRPRQVPQREFQPEPRTP